VVGVGGGVGRLRGPRARATELCRSIGLHLPAEHLRVWVTEAELENDLEAGSPASSLAERH
jgi:hypothetical protein